MGWLTKHHKQKCVYWGSPTNDGWGGRTYGDPVELDCRWEDKREKFTNMKGEEHVSSAVVYLGQDVVVNGYLYLGTLASLSSAEEGNPEAVTGTYLVQAYGKIPNIKGTDYERTAWL